MKSTDSLLVHWVRKKVFFLEITDIWSPKIHFEPGLFSIFTFTKVERIKMTDAETKNP